MEPVRKRSVETPKEKIINDGVYKKVQDTVADSDYYIAKGSMTPMPVPRSYVGANSDSLDIEIYRRDRDAPPGTEYITNKMQLICRMAVTLEAAAPKHSPLDSVNRAEQIFEIVKAKYS